MDNINTQNSSQVQNCKRSRQGRRNEKQLSFLVDYMVQHPHVATGKFNSVHGRDDLRGSWDDLVVNLNNLRNPGSWRDLKTKVSKQHSALRNAKRLTDNKAITIPELTDRENKVLGLMGFEYCDDLERLSAVVFDNLNQTATENFIFEYDEQEESIIKTSDSAQISSYQPEITVSTLKTNFRKRKLVQNQNNMAKKTLRTQLGDASDTFTKLAERNSQHMDNISLSISQLASAMNKMAENDERRLTNEENMVSVMKLLFEKM
ncbi:hypothetical protein ACI65C_004393 [Semiaphis heraclei]